MVAVMTRIGVAAAVAVAGLWAAGAQADTIRIATEGAYKPYNFKDAAGNLVGFEIDLAAELCTRMEAECEIVEQAWDGIIPSLIAKKYDAIMAGMSIKASREEVISFSRYYVNTPITFAVLSDSALVGTESAMEAITLGEVSAEEQAVIDAMKGVLNGLTVGVQTSTTHEAFMTEFMPEIDLKSYDTMDNMILDLEAGRIDAGYTSMTYLRPILEQGDDIAVIGPKMTGGPLGRGVAVGLRQEDTELRDRFNAAIDTMIADGTLSAMATEWFGTDISPTE